MLRYYSCFIFVDYFFPSHAHFLTLRERDLDLVTNTDRVGSTKQNKSCLFFLECHFLLHSAVIWRLYRTMSAHFGPLAAAAAAVPRQGGVDIEIAAAAAEAAVH